MKEDWGLFFLILGGASAIGGVVKTCLTKEAPGSSRWLSLLQNIGLAFLATSLAVPTMPIRVLQCDDSPMEYFKVFFFGFCTGFAGIQLVLLTLNRWLQAHDLTKVPEVHNK